MNKKTVMAILLASLFFSPVVYANCGNNNGNGNGCSGNDGGSTGPAGPQGPAGSNGSNGTSGSNGYNGVDAVSQSHLLGELDLRLWDTKHTSFYAFDSYGFNDAPNHDVVLDGRNAFYGVKFVAKLGSSYEERLLDKQAKQIKALESALAKLSK